MELITLYQRTLEAWSTTVQDIHDEHWSAPTPCAGWDVRELVNHVVGEDLWTVPLIQGQTIEQVGSTLDGDLLGADPRATAIEAARAAEASVSQQLPRGAKVHLSYGDEEPAEYVRQLAADHLLHGWDLSVAIDADRELEADLVAEVADWFADREELYRSAGLVGPRTGASTSDTQGDLLSAFGRRPGWGASDGVVARFAAAFGSADVDAIMALMSDDCVFESTLPPNGERHTGADAVRRVWDELFTQTPGASFTAEETFGCGDRGVLRWRFDWTTEDGTPGHVRGVDVLRLRDGLVCEKFSYVKG